MVAVCSIEPYRGVTGRDRWEGEGVEVGMVDEVAGTGCGKGGAGGGDGGGEKGPRYASYLNR